VRIVYRPPEGMPLLFDPTPEQMADIFSHTDHSYWQQGGNGEASLEVILEMEEAIETRGGMTTPDGVTIQYAARQPSVWIKQSEYYIFL
jgi:hypothetical protein